MEDFPIEEDCADWTAALAAAELWRDVAGEYIPEAGDLVFLDTDDDGAADRAAVVTDWDEAKVTAVESDSEGAVKTVTYDLTEDTQVLGYGDTNEAQAQIEVSGGEDAPQLLANMTWTHSSYLYLDISGWQDWDNDCKVVLAYQNTSDAWLFAEMECVTANSMYRIDLPDDMDLDGILIFTRMNPNIALSWDARYNQSPDLYLANATNTNVYKLSGWNSGSWQNDVQSPSSSGSSDDDDDIIDPPAGARRVYFDATLSKLDYSGSATNYSIPSTSGTIRYYATGSGVSDKEGNMTKASSYTSGSNTWSDVYYVDLPAGYSYIAFSAFDMTSITNYGGHGESTTKLTIPSDLENPCFYADTSDKVVYDGGTRDGYWDEVYTVRDSGAGKNKTVVDINQETFSHAADTLYLNTTFFDYYTDYELNGNNRDSYNVNNGASQRNWVTFRQLNQALSSAYGSGVTYPIYVGHFQTDEHGDPKFSSIQGTLGLNGYSGNYRNFFATNNSHLDSGSGSGKYDFAMQGLVKNTLSTEGNLIARNSSIDFPLFDADFIEGQNSKNTVLGKVYENVAFPFTKSEIGGVDYWTFDSSTTTLAMQQDGTTGEYYLKNVGNKGWSQNVNSTSATSGVSTTYGFFPFNATSSTTHANTYNYGFGTRIDLKFRLTSDGKVLDKDGNKVDIKFEFSGDDDVWVFIDGNLALDIGGAHGRVTGTINFGGTSTTKTANVSKVKYGCSATKEYANGLTNSFSIKGSNTSEHTLTMFYMERGMWESNMKVTFNFPDENRLEVEKDLIVNNVNPMFTQSSGTYSGASYTGDNCFDNLKFTFNIRNLATHYGKKDAATGSPIHVDGTPTGYNSSTFSKPSNGFDGYSNVFKWYAGESDDSSQWRHRRYGVITLPNTVDISSMTKLSFYMYVDGDGYDLSHMYLQLVDSSITSEYSLVDSSQSVGAISSGFTGDSNAAGCIGNTSFLKGKTYTSPGTDGRHWVKVTLDLSKFDKATGFDPTRVKYIRFGYDYSLNIYLRDITFEPSVTSNTDVGFTTEQSAIPDYGSASDARLHNATGALFTSNMSSGSHAVDSSGNFVLVDGESVMFNDQFRRGSYIHLEEVLTPKQKALFNPMWTMYEDGKPVTSLAAADSVVTLSNDSTKYGSLQNKNGNCIDDGRTEKLGSSTEQSNNSYTGSQPSDPTFVFRSYAAPANNMAGIKLKAVFTNTINCGSLYIYKQDAGSTIPSNKEFTFYVRFYDVGGSSLEDNTIVYGPFTLTVNSANGANKKEIQGIPVGTKYSIYEIKDDADYSLNSVTGGSGTFTSTVYGSEDAYRVDGTISSGPASVTFKNIKKPVVSLSVTKAWVDGNGEAITTNLPESITIQLQRRAGSNGTWQSIPSVSDRTMKPGYAGWGSYVYTFEELDKYVDYPNDQTVWQYRVLEKNGANVVAHNTSITIDGVEFVVTYSSENGAAAQDQNGNWSQTITNTQDSSISLELTKKWTYVNGQPLDPSKIPTSIMVQLQRRAKETTDQTLKSWKAVRVNGGDYVTISTNNSATWTYKFDNLEKTGSDSNGNKVDWEYRVVEWKIVDRKGIAVPNDNRVGDFKVTYHAVDGNGYVSAAPFKSGSDDTLEQTITNVYSPKTEVTVIKKWTADINNTEYKGTVPESIWVGLQRKGADAVWQDNAGILQKMQLTSDGKWTGKFENLDAVTDAGQAYEYRVVELTGENGTVVTSGNPIEYDGTTFKVTYSTTTDSETGATITTITNQVKYTASVAITKQASDTKQNLEGVTFKLEKWDSTYTTKDPNFDAQTDTTDGNGAASFSDLKSGCYLLTETQTKAGYNLLASPIKVEVKDTADGKLEVYVNGTKQNIIPDNSVYTYSTTIYNKPKLDMPATGGVGGFEFWILGGLLIMAVPLLMYTFIWYRKGGKYLQR